MKSLDKFQYDSSPHTNEEVEELDEISIVGMVRSAGQALKNSPVVKKGTELVNKVRSNISSPSPSPSVQNTPIEQKRNKLSNEINKQSKKVERVQQRSDKKITNAANNLSKSISRKKEVVNRAKNMPLTMNRIKSDKRNQLIANTQKKRDDVVKKDAKIDQTISDLKRPKDQATYDRARKAADKDPSLTKPRLMTRLKRFGYKDPEEAKNLTRGGLSSKLVRNVASVGKAIGQGLAVNPTNKVAYNAKGDGYSGAFGGLGDNVKSVGQNVLKAPTFSSTKEDPKTGKLTKGDQVGTVGDKLGLTSLTNRKGDNLNPPNRPEITGGVDDAATRRRTNLRDKGNVPVTTNITDTPPADKPQRVISKTLPTKKKTSSTQSSTTKSRPPSTRFNPTEPFQDDDGMTTTGGGQGSAVNKNAVKKAEMELERRSKKGQRQGGVTAADGVTPISRFGRQQPYVTYNIPTKMVDANPNLEKEITDK